MTDLQRKVYEFRTALELPIGDYFDPKVRNGLLHVALLVEEVAEFAAAVAAGDLVAAADAIADIEVIANGAAVDFGLDMSPIVDDVHAANMRKVGGPVRADGKRLKPPGWVGPDVAGVIERQRGSR